MSNVHFCTCGLIFDITEKNEKVNTEQQFITKTESKTEYSSKKYVQHFCGHFHTSELLIYCTYSLVLSI